MKKRLFFIAAMLFSMTQGMWAQTTNETDTIDKLSITTQMFLDEINGDNSPKRSGKSKKRPGLIPVDATWQNKNANRLYAAPETIDGKAYIAAYLRLNDPSDKKEVEATGVIFQEEFDNGLYTSLIPVEAIEKLAGISNVKRIEVSELKTLSSVAARQITRVDDLLSLSSNAQTAGLTTTYDGTGVLLGIIDTGIDFQHIAFKDTEGNYRMKRAYIYNGVTASEYSSFNDLTTDNKEEDHGTHTASTAGGSSVIANGNTVTVTNDHTQATYGGMAPGTDLYLAGIYHLSDTYISNALRKIVQYADNNGMPVVVSNSWGSMSGPHDGSGTTADVFNSLFGDSHPNHIALFATANNGGRAKADEGGGYHVSGMASSSNPLRTIARAATYSNADGGSRYLENIACAWCRSTSVTSMTCKIYVLDNNTGEVLTSVEVTPKNRRAVTVKGLEDYYDGTLKVYKDKIQTNKTQLVITSAEGLESKDGSWITQNGSNYFKSSYTLALEFYPSEGTATIDVWSGSYGYFSDCVTTEGYTWKAGSDDMSVSDEATIPSVISIGAYVSANQWTDYRGNTFDLSNEYTIGDIADFSSYATAEESPTGLFYPWITAPGARLAAGVNHYHTNEVDSYSYYNNNADLVVNDANSPYAMMEGTSMATPVAAGIVSLWLQAAKEVGKELTVNDVKHIMKMTAVHDAYTSGSNATHFGNGKIDALAGIRYILNEVVLPDEGGTNGNTNSEMISQSVSNSASTGVPANVTLSNRIIYKDTEWNTLCLPFDLDDFADTPLEGATVKTLEDASFADNTLTLTFSESSLTAIEAGVPYIVKWADSNSNVSDPKFKDVQLSTVSPDDKAITFNGVVTFKGSFDPVPFMANDTKTLFLGSNSTLYYPSENITVNACRAWFELQGDLVAGNAEGNSVNAFVLDFNGNSTDIKSFPITARNTPSTGWYMLDGRHLNGQPATKGIYINNGKKVVIK